MSRLEVTVSNSGSQTFLSPEAFYTPTRSLEESHRRQESWGTPEHEQNGAAPSPGRERERELEMIQERTCILRQTHISLAPSHCIWPNLQIWEWGGLTK